MNGTATWLFNVRGVAQLKDFYSPETLNILAIVQLEAQHCLTSKFKFLFKNY
jgi:hypothetical protein